jgi:hypothetical protein
VAETNTHHAMFDRRSWVHTSKLSQDIRNHSLWKVTAKVVVHDALHDCLPKVGIDVPPKRLLSEIRDISDTSLAHELSQGERWRLAISDLNVIANTAHCAEMADSAFDMACFLNEQAYILSQHKTRGFRAFEMAA